MKRKKRLKKGIESLHEQVEIHKEKLREAIEEGNEELAGYYKKDLARLEGEERKKREQLERVEN
jgi:phage shock protein A